MAVVRAAGCVVWRFGDREPEVLLVHRPRYDDWTFPKGKIDRGEHVITAALREVREETGVKVRLGPPLPYQEYLLSSRQTKHVVYWAARPRKNADVSAYEPNAEIDKVNWTRVSKARKKLSYSRDRDLLDAFDSAEYTSTPLIIVRHADARRRKTWRHEDSERPLIAEGHRQAQRLVPLLRAYGVVRVVTSDAVRCVDTILPFINATRAQIRLDVSMSEEDTKPEKLKRRMRKLLDSSKPIAVCSHRPVLPEIFSAIGIEAIHLETGEMLIAHRRKGKIVAVERHRV